MTGADDDATLLTGLSPEEKERYRNQWDKIEISQKIATGFLDTYKDGRLSFQKLCENSWLVLKDNTDLAAVRNHTLGWIVKEALESRPKRTKESTGPSEIPQYVVDQTKLLVKLAKDRDGLPRLRGDGRAFEATATCWRRQGLSATAKSVEGWYYDKS